MGVSPEVSGVIGALGMASSSKPLTLGFDLEDLSKHMFAIEHDCSFSRQDALIGDNNAFNQELWEVALAKINGSAHVNPIEIGRAKSARIQDALRRNPQSIYGPRAAAFGYLEHGLLLTALGSPIPGISRLDYLRCFFEDERLPYHLGWRPLPEATNVATALAVGIASIAGDSHILTDAGRVIIGTPSVCFASSHCTTERLLTERPGSSADSRSTQVRLPRQSHQHDHRSRLRFESNASIEVAFGEGLMYSTAAVVVV